MSLRYLFVDVLIFPFDRKSREDHDLGAKYCCFLSVAPQTLEGAFSIHFHLRLDIGWHMRAGSMTNRRLFESVCAFDVAPAMSLQVIIMLGRSIGLLLVRIGLNGL